MLALGIGPVGIAFYLWDIGVKKGDLRFLGVASFAAPPLSTLVPLLAGFAQAGWNLAIAVALGVGVGGAAIAGRAGKSACGDAPSSSSAGPLRSSRHLCDLPREGGIEAWARLPVSRPCGD